MPRPERLAPQPGTRWRHYKGGICEVIALATAEWGPMVLVVYRCEKGNCWARPLAEFLGKVNTGDGVRLRFEEIPACTQSK